VLPVTSVIRKESAGPGGSESAAAILGHITPRKRDAAEGN
jgi:hypothetical protein